MSTIPAADDVLDPDEAVYDLHGVASLLHVPVSRVLQHLKERQLLGIRRGGAVVVPKAFFDESGHVIKPLPGLLVVLSDGGFRDTEIIRWLFTPDESLTITRDGGGAPQPNARPIDALVSHQAREVLRRAQAMAY